MRIRNKTATIIIGIITAIVILINTAPDHEITRFSDHKGDFPLGNFNMPTHLMKIP